LIAFLLTRHDAAAYFTVIFFQTALTVSSYTLQEDAEETIAINGEEEQVVVVVAAEIITVISKIR